jgi:hypothetical protein
MCNNIGFLMSEHFCKGLLKVEECISLLLEMGSSGMDWTNLTDSGYQLRVLNEYGNKPSDCIKC